MSSNEAYLRSALQTYKNVDLAKRDIMNCIRQYTDLRPVRDTFVFNDGSEDELLCLSGTVPVSYKDYTYNIPVCLWLLDTHPYNPPMAYVKPTSTMQIKPGRHVDTNGRVYLPYLHDWKNPESDLLGLVQIMMIVFGEEPPVFTRSTSSSQPQQTSAESTELSNIEIKEAFLGRALSMYSNVELAKTDIMNCISNYTDLRPVKDTFVFDDGNEMELLCLDGTVPVSNQGQSYNIPVCLWLLDTHPYNPPIAYIKPTSNMEIKPGHHVDNNGRVQLPYLHDWKHPESDLLGIVQIMMIVFGEEPPVFTCSTSSSQPQQTSAECVNCRGCTKEQTISESNEVYLGSVLSMYSNVELAKADIMNCIRNYTDLRPVKDTFVLDDGNEMELLSLAGTVPVSYQGQTCNIPVCLWLLDTHPYEPPVAYVKPSNTIDIRPGRHVDKKGRVCLNYLNHWKHPQSDLLGLVEVMIAIFGEELPVFSDTNE